MLPHATPPADDTVSSVSVPHSFIEPVGNAGPYDVRARTLTGTVGSAG
jgi:hypothetical protein